MTFLIALLHWVLVLELHFQMKGPMRHLRPVNETVPLEYRRLKILFQPDPCPAIGPTKETQYCSLSHYLRGMT